MGFETKNIRNIAIAGHNGTGKSSLFEQILFNAGVIPKAESVDSGKSVSDYAKEEIDRGFSIHTTLANLQWRDRELNILDTPGTSAFIGEVVASFRAAESAVMVIDAQAGVQIETIKLWRRLNQRNMSRVVFINKMDRERASFDGVIDDLKTKFKKTCVPVSIPIGDGPNFKGIINLIENKAYLVHNPQEKDKSSDIPEDMKDLVESYRATLIETAAEGDDELLDTYFEKGTLTEDEIRTGLLEGLRDNKIVPVLAGSAKLNNGIASLLNFLTFAAPTPACYAEAGVDGEGNPVDVTISSHGSMKAFVFKTAIDQYVGRMSYIKVASGTLKGDSDIFAHGEKVRIGKIFRAVGKKVTEVPELSAGDIGIITKVNALKTNDTMTAGQDLFHFNKLALPQPIYSLTISGADKKSEDKMNEALHKIAEEDLTFTIQFNTETQENVISGMGELHINLILQTVEEKQKIKIETKSPRIAYRETITKPTQAEYTHKKQSGGHGQFGRVVLEVAPVPRGQFYSFQNAIKGGSVSKGYMPGIEKGLHEAMEEGFLAGYPVVDVGIRIIDGKEHPVDSSEMAFKLAAKGALKKAFETAGTKLLEPIMRLSVFAEEQYLGDILSDLSAKRARVIGQENLGGGIIEIDAEAPQGELQKYALDLKAITSGTGSFEVEFDHYQTLSGKLADKVIADSKVEA